MTQSRPDDAACPAPGLSIARWRWHDRDRLYVTHDDGTKVGYWDLVTDEGHPERPELAALLRSAYASWVRARPDHALPDAAPITTRRAGARTS